MENTSLVTFIQKILPISPLRAGEIAGHFRQVNIARNDFFLKAGKVSNEYLFLESGFMRAFTYDTEGNDVTTDFCTSNQIVFEIASYFMRTPSTENIQALTDCRGAFILMISCSFCSTPFRSSGSLAAPYW